MTERIARIGNYLDSVKPGDKTWISFQLPPNVVGIGAGSKLITNDGDWTVTDVDYPEGWIQIGVMNYGEKTQVLIAILEVVVTDVVILPPKKGGE